MNLLNEFADASQQLEKDSLWQEAEATKLNSLRNSIIQAISNLLSANIDSGLMHSIGKLYVFLLSSSNVIHKYYAILFYSRYSSCC